MVKRIKRRAPRRDKGRQKLQRSEQRSRLPPDRDRQALPPSPLPADLAEQLTECCICGDPPAVHGLRVPHVGTRLVFYTLCASCAEDPDARDHVDDIADGKKFRIEKGAEA